MAAEKPFDLPTIRQVTDPYWGGEAVTPSDTVELGTLARGIYVGVTGDVTLITKDDDTLLFKAVPAGKILPVMTKRVSDTGTDATDMVALY